MALGDANVNQNKTYSQTYYSRWAIKQKDGKLRLTANFSSGLMKICIQEQAEDYKYNTVADITLSPVKAKTFAAEIDKFINDISSGTYSGKAYGVDTGIKDTRPIIAATMINDNPYIVVGKITPSGEFESRVDYSINLDYHYGLEWTDFDNMEVDKVFYNMSELEQLRDLCIEYSRSAYGAVASSTLEMMKWDYSIARNLDAVAEKLGVERVSYNNSKSTGNSFFNKENGAKYGSGDTPAKANRVSLEDIDV